VGIGIVRPHIRPRTAQFASLYVSNGHRSQGIGRHLGEELERLAANGATRRWSSRQRRLSTPCASTSTEALSRRRSRCRSFTSSSPRMCICRSACKSRLCIRLTHSSRCSYERSFRLHHGLETVGVRSMRPAPSASEWRAEPRRPERARRPRINTQAFVFTAVRKAGAVMTRDQGQPRIPT
jgi:Acetyltransferase (GNAT) family